MQARGWQRQLRLELDERSSRGLLRGLSSVEPRGRFMRRGGRELINLAGNDYLGLSRHPHLREAAVRAVQAHGTGAGASRLTVGHHDWHAQVESRFAAFKHAQAALLLPTGYMANLAVVTSLAGGGDLVCIDKLCHASLIDAARLSGATVRVYPHGSSTKLERLLRDHLEAAKKAGGGRRVARRLIVTDSVFSMDGDTADLATLCGLAERYDAILVVDEAHGTGVLGEHGSGLVEAQGVIGRVDVVVSTASKAMGGLGGIVTACREVIDTLVNRARPLIYTTAVPPAQAAAIGAALDVIRDEPWRRRRLTELANRLRTGLCELGWSVPGTGAVVADFGGGERYTTPIVPVVVGEPGCAVELASYLARHGLFAPAIRPPTVAPGTSRVRISLRADLEDGDVDRLLAALGSWRGPRLRPPENFPSP